jgi:GNAT superfamily N-acetyltransferase
VPPRIRAATREDGPAFVGLVRALAEFEKLPGPTDEAAARLLEDAFGDRPRYELLVGEVENQVVAYAVYFFTYSTFLARPTLFLEDVFVHPSARRLGLGTEIMGRLKEIAGERGCGRFEWMVLDWNTGAQDMYRELGATIFKEWQLCRVLL